MGKMLFAVIQLNNWRSFDELIGSCAILIVGYQDLIFFQIHGSLRLKRGVKTASYCVISKYYYLF